MLVLTDKLLVQENVEFVAIDSSVKSVVTDEEQGRVGSDSDFGEGSEIGEEACQIAYENMYA